MNPAVMRAVIVFIHNLGWNAPKIWCPKGKSTGKKKQ